VIGRIDLDRLVFLDESGVSTQMTRLYARCRGGARIHETTPDGRWKILTILGAIVSVYVWPSGRVFRWMGILDCGAAEAVLAKGSA